MTVKERLLMLKLLEHKKKNPEFAKQIGIDVKVVKKANDNKHHK